MLEESNNIQVDLRCVNTQAIMGWMYSVFLHAY